MIRSGIDGFQVAILTPLPGTALMERVVAENRMAYTNFPKDWDKFRMSYVKIRPRGTTAETITPGIIISRIAYTHFLPFSGACSGLSFP